MRTALDADLARLDEHEQNFVSRIKENRWFGTHVFGDHEGPGFSYTTGFWLRFAFPELILFSVPREVAHDTFWHVFRELDAGRRLAIGEPLPDIFENVPAQLLPVSTKHYAEYLGWSRWFYGGDKFECAQLVFSDREGRFPWSPDASASFAKTQPDLTKGDWHGRR
jgi:hypothetical protein